MRISIVTAVRNAQATLEATISSVLAADHGDLEYIVVDGASTDGTLDILRRYENRIDRFISEPDSGISQAFNKGIKLATGEVVGLISADDELCPGALHAVAEAFANHPGADVVHGNALYRSQDGREVLTRPDPDFSRILTHSPVRHAAMFVRRSSYERFGLYDERYRLAMDYELVLRFYRAGAHFLMIDEPLARISGGGASGRSYRLAIGETREISIRYGRAPVPAYLTAGLSVVRTVIKRLLQRGGVGWIVYAYRTWSARRRARANGPASGGGA